MGNAIVVGRKIFEQVLNFVDETRAGNCERPRFDLCTWARSSLKSSV
jgi:hypothetical protein